MINKTIIIGLVAIAFVVGSMMTEAAVFADKDDKKGNKGIIAALTAIADAITGIDPNVTVEPIVNVDVPPAEVQIIGIDGPAGPQGEQGLQGEQGSAGADGTKGDQGDAEEDSTLNSIGSNVYKVEELYFFPAGISNFSLSCEPGDLVLNAISVYSQNFNSVIERSTSDTWTWVANNNGGAGGITFQIHCLDITP